MAAKARMQINLMLSKVEDIKQVVGLREMAFPLFWFETVSCCRMFKKNRIMVAYLLLIDRELKNYLKKWIKSLKW